MDNKTKKMFIILFILIIILPFLQMKFHFWDAGELNENRYKATKPALNFSEIKNGQYMLKFEQYFNDHLGFRGWLIRINNVIDYELFRVDSHPAVLLGRDNYLFFRETLPDYHRAATMSDVELERIAAGLARLQQNLRQRNVDFLFFMAPNKNTIYPEYMPFPSNNPQGMSNREKLQEKLRQHGVDSLDLVPMLQQGKKTGEMYFRRETHWNYVGGFMAAREIAMLLGKRTGIDFQISVASCREAGHVGDLDVMLGRSEEERTLVPDIAITPIDRKLPPSLWYRDSFADNMLPLLEFCSADMTNFHYGKEPMYTNINKSLPGKEQVVFEIVERSLPQLRTYDFDVFDESPALLRPGHQTTTLETNRPTIIYQTALIANPGYSAALVQGTDPQLIWKLPLPAPARFAYLEFVAGPPDSPGGIYWLREGDAAFDEQKTVKFHLSPNKTKYLIELPAATRITDLRLSLGNRPGLEYQLRTVELIDGERAANP